MSRYAVVPTAETLEAPSAKNPVGTDIPIGIAVAEPVKKQGFLFDHKHGIFFTYKWAEVKRDMCRAWIRIGVILLIASLYIGMWSWCDVCILGLTAASCLGTCTICSFLSFNCIAGVLASLYKGFRIGSEWATLDIHWKI
jgi:hypothetical protein